MDQPQYTDLCAFIRMDIEITQQLIDDDRVGLQHPERLTHDDVMRLKGDIERRGELLDSFHDAFRRCRAENEQHVVRPHPNSEIGSRTAQLDNQEVQS